MKNELEIAIEVATKLENGDRGLVYDNTFEWIKKQYPDADAKKAGSLFWGIINPIDWMINKKKLNKVTKEYYNPQLKDE